VILKSPATVDDLRHVPKDGRVYELVNGTIVVTPAGMRHSAVSARITTLLGSFVLSRGGGEVYTEGVGIQLPSGNVRCPDVCFVRTEKLPEGRSPVDFGRLIPDLVVEVLSPGDSAPATAPKLAEYLACGVPVVWVADPERRAITVHRPGQNAVEYGADAVLTAEPVLPGFSCRVSDCFPARAETLIRSFLASLRRSLTKSGRAPDERVMGKVYPLGSRYPCIQSAP
jgi:Uma2 family endonuclease